MPNGGELDEATLPDILRAIPSTDLPAFMGPCASSGITLLCPASLAELPCNAKKIKSGPSVKPDVGIRTGETTWAVSVKSFRHAPPAIVNHTRRELFMKNPDIESEWVSAADRLVTSYWDRAGDAPEDVPLTALTVCPADKDLLVKLLAYFAFRGTGRKRSRREADSVLEVHGTGKATTHLQFIPCATQTEKENYIRSKWDFMRISMRTKGMGKGVQREANTPWMRSTGPATMARGALHVRIMKGAAAVAWAGIHVLPIATCN